MIFMHLPDGQYQAATIPHCIKKDLAKVKSEITEIQLVLEHDTNKKIAMIAEGNFNLTRKPG